MHPKFGKKTLVHLGPFHIPVFKCSANLKKFWKNLGKFQEKCLEDTKNILIYFNTNQILEKFRIMRRICRGFSKEFRSNCKNFEKIF